MRACFYARVSTEEEKQANALKKQCKEARMAIQANDWILVNDGEYIDEGKSGTTVRRRDAYQKLFQDLCSDKFDVIVIKSQDRLMRSAKDWYLFLAKMTESNKKLFMYLDNRFYQSDDSLITGIKAILAEEYSRDLSKKLNNSNKHRQEKGSSIITNGLMWGYEQKDGELIVNEYEAAIIRRIFQMYADGLGTRRIKNTLDNEGVLSRRGTSIGLSTLKRIVKSPTYKGTIVQNRTHFDFNTKRIIENDESEWYVHENRVPAIVSEDLWQRANDIVNSRRQGKSRKGLNKGTYELSGKIVCSECGARYHKVRIKEKGEQIPYWICGTYQEKGRKHPKNRPAKEQGCDGRNLKESVIFDVIRTISTKYTLDIASRGQAIIDALKSISMSDEREKQIASLNSKIAETKNTQSVLLEKLLNGTITDTIFSSKNKELEDKIAACNNNIEQIQKSAQSVDEERQHINDIIEAIKSPELAADAKFKYILNHVKRIDVYPNHAVITLSFFDPDDGQWHDSETSVDMPNTISKCDPYQTTEDTFRIQLNLSNRYNIPYEFIVRIR